MFTVYSLFDIIKYDLKKYRNEQNYTRRAINKDVCYDIEREK